MDIASPDPAAAQGKPPHTIALEILHTMVFTLPRPAADAPEATWNAVVQGGLDKLGTLDPHDSIEAMLAIQVIAADSGALDAYRLAFEPNTAASQALRQRASATALVRSLTGAVRLLKEQRTMPAVPERDWDGVAPGLVTAWQEAPVRPPETRSAAGGKAAAEPETIIKWIDELNDAELAEAVEQERREKAGEPPLPAKPGPKMIYRYKPDDYARRWKPDPRAWRHYPGWENMTMAQRREFFGYTYDGPGAPLDMLSPAAQIAIAAEAAEAEVAAAEAALKPE
jgi:hypothetical protein